MRHIQQFTLLLFLWITLLAPVGIVASWAGPVEDKALRDAAVSTDSKFQTQHER